MKCSSLTFFCKTLTPVTVRHLHREWEERFTIHRLRHRPGLLLSKLLRHKVGEAGTSGQLEFFVQAGQALDRVRPRLLLDRLLLPRPSAAALLGRRGIGFRLPRPLSV